MKNLIVAIITILAVAALAGCNSEALTPENSDITLKMAVSIEGLKAIGVGQTYSNAMNAISFEYKATCSSTPGAAGTQASWTTLIVNEGTATLVDFSRGTWTIDVRAKNANGGVIAQGSTGAFNLTQANASSISIVLTGNVTAYSAGNSAANVNVAIGLTVPTLSSGSVSVRYVTIANIGSLNASGTGGTSISMSSTADYKTAISGSSITHNTASSGSTAYYGSASLAPGLYALQVFYKDGGSIIAGQTMAFRVVELSPFAINGSLTSGEYIDLDVSSITLDSKAITVTVTSAAAVSNGNLTCTVSASGGSGYSYTWYLDGTVVAGQTSATYNKPFNDKGSHILSCIVRGTVGGDSSAGYASSAFSGDYRGDIYTVAFNANKPTGAQNDVSGSMASQTFKVNTAQNLTRNVFSLTGFDFVGWATSASGVKVYNDMQSVNNLASAGATLTLYAKWTGLVAITLDPNGGTMGGSTSNVILNGTYEANYPISNYETGGAYVPLKTGMIFVGWDASN